MASQPSPRRRFQFRLRTLMIGVTLAAVVCGGTAFYRNRYWARKHADELYAEWQAEKAVGSQDTRTNQFCFPRIVAGRNWCLAECAVPFSDHAAACRRYADAMVIEIKMAKDLLLPSPYAEYLDRHKQEAEDWLAAGTATGEPEQLPYSTH